MTNEQLQALLISIHESAALLAHAIRDEFHSELFKETAKAERRRERVSSVFQAFEGSIKKQIAALKNEQYWL